MPVQSLRLQNFTAFEDLDVSFSPGLNVIVGANATGKTHVLKAIYSLLSAAREPKESGNSANDVFFLTVQLIKRIGLVFRPLSSDDHDLVRIPRHQDAKLGLIVNEQLVELSLLAKDKSFGATNWPRHPVFPFTVFIPSREVLSFYPGFVAANDARELSFDATYVDLCRQLSAAALKRIPAALSDVADSIESLISARVELRRDRFFFEIKNARAKDWVEANLVAEGHRKLATICQLIRNGGIRKGSVLLLDEPEASLNPQLAGPLTGLFCDLAAAGVQVILATHDYALATRLSLEAEFNTKTGAASQILFHGLYRETPTSPVLYEAGATMADLKHNAMLDEFATLYDHEQELFRRAAQ